MPRVGATLYVIGPHGGSIAAEDRSLAVDRTMFTTQSVECDALVVAGGGSAASLGRDAYVALSKWTPMIFIFVR